MLRGLLFHTNSKPCKFYLIPQVMVLVCLKAACFRTEICAIYVLLVVLCISSQGANIQFIHFQVVLLTEKFPFLISEKWNKGV